jgi:outer membrane murein-binding lipoprotein Lpp
MAEVTNELIYKLMLEIQAEQKAMRAAIHAEQEVLTAKVGTLAEGMVSMRKQIDGLRDDVHALRTDVQMIAIAVDQHTTRLDHIEKHLGIGTPAN